MPKTMHDSRDNTEVKGKLLKKAKFTTIPSCQRRMVRYI